MPRIVSLIASSTEIVCALGFEDHLVGRSHECDFPESVTRLPVCTEPKFNPDGTSYEIDQRVKAILQEGLSVYRVHADILKELQPELILTQDQCEVCAVSLRDIEEAVYDWIDARPRIVSLEPHGLSDVWATIGQVAEALGEPKRGAALVRELQQRMEAIAERAQALPRTPAVACIEWIEPLMACGNWVPELVEMAGGENRFGEAGHHSPWMTWEALQEGDPEVIAVMPCGYDIAQTRQNMPALTTKPGWSHLQAAQSGRVYLLDGSQYFNRPGPRLVESVEVLAEILHPGAFQFGYEGTGWEAL
ncbi:MAG: cobalamin-binding protein [Nitrospinota bacterium]